MDGLILVGTVHLDPEGHIKLLALLGELRPETVTVDVSTYAIEFRRTLGADLLERLSHFRRVDGSLPPALAAVEAQLALPYEYTASDAYAERAGARVSLLGDSRESRKRLDLLVRELMPTDNLIRLATREEPPLAEQVAREWERARRDLAAGPPLGLQDKRVARQIRQMARFDSVVHVAGWEHLRGLATRLAGLNPQVRLLSP